MIEIYEESGCVVFGARIAPGASRNRIAGEHGRNLKISITARPVDGEANKELVKFLAKYFGVSKGRVSIISGAASRNKRIKIEGLTPLKMREILQP